MEGISLTILCLMLILNFFITANIKTRALRRYKELKKSKEGNFL
jgi:cytidylate kinase